MFLHYIVIPLITAAVALLGSAFTVPLSEWYRTLKKPSWNPPPPVFSAVWTVIFILATVSVLIVWNKAHVGPVSLSIWLFVVNAFLNVLWSYLFFGKHLVGTAVIEAVLLDASVIALIVLIWPVSNLAAGLLLPYALWVTFAVFLNFTIWRLNRMGSLEQNPLM